MVVYFSATGNTEFIAKELATRLNDECVNLLDRIKAGDNTPLHSEKPFVICAPIYVCEMPRFMTKYLKKQSFEGSKDAYFVFTSGGYCGPAGVLAKKIVKAKKMNYHGYAEFQMPRNYVASDAYPMLGKEETEQRITASYGQLETVTADILNGKELTPSRHVYVFETLITVPFNPVWCKLKLKAKSFHTTDACMGCGKCAKLCPLNNVEIVDGKPVWGKQCTHCMACIANCPTGAIEYGKITQNKERYTFKKYRYVVKALNEQNEQ